MLFDWLNAKDAREFGGLLAKSFIERVPVAGQLNEQKFEAKVRATMRHLDYLVIEYKRSHNLNVYKKARLGNAFKWTLKDAGYNPQYVDKLTDLLILKL